jgi:23S rRNA pseudouridine2605 synthase
MAAKRNDKPGQRVQLHRAISKLGWGSRTVAWDWIRSGKVRVNGRAVTDPLTWIDLNSDEVSCADQSATKATPVTLALHKPRGVVTTRKDEHGRRAVYDLLPEGLPWLFPAGRLDADSEGLLIFTNDSRLAVSLTDPAHHVPKTYEVTIRGVPGAETLARLRRGIDLSDGPTRPVKVEVIEQRAKGAAVVRMVLTEGRNRQIRRMWAAVGHKVKRLVRVAIGSYDLGDLPAGKCRRLGRPDIDRLQQSRR